MAAPGRSGGVKSFFGAVVGAFLQRLVRVYKLSKASKNSCVCSEGSVYKACH